LLAALVVPRWTFARLSARARVAAGALAAVVPPEEARLEHAALVDSMRRLEEEVDAIAKRRDLGRVARFEVLTDSQAFSEGSTAINALRRKGYRLP
jgi:hypothetical protein